MGVWKHNIRFNCKKREKGSRALGLNSTAVLLRLWFMLLEPETSGLGYYCCTSFNRMQSQRVQLVDVSSSSKVLRCIRGDGVDKSATD